MTTSQKCILAWGQYKNSRWEPLNDNLSLKLTNAFIRSPPRKKAINVRPRNDTDDDIISDNLEKGDDTSGIVIDEVHYKFREGRSIRNSRIFGGAPVVTPICAMNMKGEIVVKPRADFPVPELWEIMCGG